MNQLIHVRLIKNKFAEGSVLRFGYKSNLKVSQVDNVSDMADDVLQFQLI